MECTAQFRVHAFNAFNHIGPGNPNNCIECSDGGEITGLAIDHFPGSSTLT
jgi:hypothetical protein